MDCGHWLPCPIIRERTHKPPHKQWLVGMGRVPSHCHDLLLLDSVGAMHPLSTPQTVAHGHGVGAASSLCPGKGGGGHIISMMWQVYKGRGAYLVGPSLDRPPSTIPSSIVIVVPCLQPSQLLVVGCWLLSHHACLAVTPPGHGVHVFALVGLKFSLKNKLNVQLV